MITNGPNGPTPPLARLTACGDVEEANAAVGAAISTGSMATEHATVLGEVQRDLLDLAAALAGPADPPDPADPAALTGPAERDAQRRLAAALAHYAPPEPPPPGSHVLAGGSDAAGLLRLARAVTRRAERSVRVLADAQPGRVPAWAADYLGGLAALLPAVAQRIEREDTRMWAMGACGDRPSSEGTA
ncbi:ATP:cob(I)alamin adenosyltransferase [Streptomyces armeniacus]|uniref:Corrinoid adenosyltransferase n=1 Tax=Streptomyces armeniacus TaxID=83291 RepID=A0A345XM65_9ACTN|nr:ATP:cob(I)alamin adenosyltransferase [Streptomyces armeniacus]AXK32731.1 ATP:cob(I)alamin adenosyltransferase [Streptomyces armeniacus]